jgi:hypothetical protein
MPVYVITIILSLFALLVSGGAISFFIKYGTRLAMVEKESGDTKQRVDKHAADIITANTQVALIGQALSAIQSSLNDIKKDVRDWMQAHSAQN